jgi:hypothetical protein
MGNYVFCWVHPDTMSSLQTEQKEKRKKTKEKHNRTDRINVR